MSYVEQSSADILNYIIAFSKQEVTEEIRNAAFEAIKPLMIIISFLII